MCDHYATDSKHLKLELPLPLSSGVAGPSAHGALTSLELSLCGLPAGRHQEDTAGSRRTRSAGEVSSPDLLSIVT